jgi:hypothetical protein
MVVCYIDRKIHYYSGRYSQLAKYVRGPDAGSQINAFTADPDV